MIECYIPVESTPCAPGCWCVRPLRSAVEVSTQDQHFVPQMVLKRWCEDKKFIAMSRRDGSGLRERVSTKGTAWATEFYTVPGGSLGAIRKAEDALSVAEDAASPLIDRLIARDSFCPGDRDLLAMFFALGHTRTPTAREYFFRELDAAATAGPRERTDLVNRVFSDASALFPLFSERRWELMCGPEGTFIVGDSPVVELTDQTEARTFVVPLSDRCSLFMVPAEDESWPITPEQINHCVRDQAGNRIYWRPGTTPRYEVPHKVIGGRRVQPGEH